MTRTAIQSGQKLLFIGDSITDCGRHDRDTPLGVGYVRMLSDLLHIREPAKHINVINRGIGGNTIEDLASRWVDHVLSHRPDWLVVKIGINDINRYETDPKGNPHQSPERFEEIYDEVITLTRATLPETRILLVSPFYACQDTLTGNYRSRILEGISVYVRAVEHIADKHDTLFINLHSRVQELIREMPADTFAEDAVHPSPAGALFIAEQVYQALCIHEH